jgi:hypothetical protein
MFEFRSLLIDSRSKCSARVAFLPLLESSARGGNDETTDTMIMIFFVRRTSEYGVTTGTKIQNCVPVVAPFDR